MPPLPDAEPLTPYRNTLSWLLRLRWTAVAGQAVVIFVVSWVLRISLPLHALVAILLTTMMSNGLLYDVSLRTRRGRQWLIAAVLSFDVVALTAMLYLTGGIHNPFTSFYFVHIALGAMVLPTSYLWALATLCGAGFGFLCFFHLPLDTFFVQPGLPITGRLAFALHTKGMIVATLLTIAWIAYFAARMQKILKAREQELAEMQLHAARNEQFASLATLAAGVAHELGSPLGTIAVASRELERTLEQGDAACATRNGLLEDAQLIRTEVNRCRAILERLSARSTGGIGDPVELMTPRQLAEEVLQSVGPACAARLRIHAALGDEPLLLPREAVIQALGVLIQNACDADTSGHPVTLEIAECEGQLCFAVRDIGPGLTPAAQRRASEPFFTTKAPGQGMGLGLFLVRTLASRLGGKLTLALHPGGGTLATLALPLPTAAETAEATPAATLS
ncbi:MAG TPA: ATP-binding protein [Chthoniobacteraceae bacterium]|nr:ATP-binding protein [Chthoniobacteraceae bacterium]